MRRWKYLDEIFTPPFIVPSRLWRKSAMKFVRGNPKIQIAAFYKAVVGQKLS